LRDSMSPADGGSVSNGVFCVERDCLRNAAARQAKISSKKGAGALLALFSECQKRYRFSYTLLDAAVAPQRY